MSHRFSNWWRRQTTPLLTEEQRDRLIRQHIQAHKDAVAAEQHQTHVYVAGPMRGYERFNFDAFERATEWLRDRGFKVTSPAEMDLELGLDPDIANTDAEADFDVADALRRDFAVILDADGVVLLAGWENSAGARAERWLAETTGKDVWRYDERIIGGQPAGGVLVRLDPWAGWDGDPRKPDPYDGATRAAEWRESFDLQQQLELTKRLHRARDESAAIEHEARQECRQCGQDALIEYLNAAAEQFGAVEHVEVDAAETERVGYDVYETKHADKLISSEESWFEAEGVRFKLWLPEDAPPFPWDIVRLTIEPKKGVHEESAEVLDIEDVWPETVADIGAEALATQDGEGDWHLTEAGKRAAGTGSDTANPKDALGTKKVQLHLVPESFIIRVAQAMTDGAAKYGPFNWRHTAVRATVYQSAAKRHLAAWFDGEEVAADSGVPHLAHAAACIAILVDAEATGQLVDDRPEPGAAARLLTELTES